MNETQPSWFHRQNLKEICKEITRYLTHLLKWTFGETIFNDCYIFTTIAFALWNNSLPSICLHFSKSTIYRNEEIFTISFTEITKVFKHSIVRYLGTTQTILSETIINTNYMLKATIRAVY